MNKGHVNASWEKGSHRRFVDCLWHGIGSRYLCEQEISMKSMYRFWGLLLYIVGIGLLFTACPNASQDPQPDVPSRHPATQGKIYGTWIWQGSQQSPPANFDQFLIISESNWHIFHTNPPGTHANFAISKRTPATNTTGIYQDYSRGYRFDGCIVSRQGFYVFGEISYFFVFLNPNGQSLRIYWGGGRTGIMNRSFVRQ